MQTRIIRIAVREDGTIALLPSLHGNEPPIGEVDVWKLLTLVEGQIYAHQRDLGVIE